MAGGVLWRIPAITDFRAKGTIMGPAGLTAVFGMGTGVAPPVWSPGNRRADDEVGAAGASARALAEESCGWWFAGGERIADVDRDQFWPHAGP